MLKFYVSLTLQSGTRRSYFALAQSSADAWERAFNSFGAAKIVVVPIGKLA
jgi:hypothetical protein